VIVDGERPINFQYAWALLFFSLANFTRCFAMVEWRQGEKSPSQSKHGVLELVLNSTIM
jgi:hypothetical protein